jgi:uncharacterized protein YeaO (DUF488 family)
VLGSVRTRRWNDPAQPGDGARVLVCRYRPRGVRRTDETWHEWAKDLAPSRELHAAYYGRHGRPLDFETYRRRYLAEMEGAAARASLRELRERVRAGETVTLLCSSACTDESRCHRSLLRERVLGESD